MSTPTLSNQLLAVIRLKQGIRPIDQMALFKDYLDKTIRPMSFQTFHRQWSGYSMILLHSLICQSLLNVKCTQCIQMYVDIQWKAFPEAWSLLQQQWGDQLHINAHDFGIRLSTSTCPHTFGHVVYPPSTVDIQQVSWLKFYFLMQDPCIEAFSAQLYILPIKMYPQNKLPLIESLLFSTSCYRLLSVSLLAPNETPPLMWPCPHSIYSLLCSVFIPRVMDGNTLNPLEIVL